jgi:hypothetical protein
MGSDDLNLRVLSTSSDDEKERKAAAKVLRLLGRDIPHCQEEGRQGPNVFLGPANGGPSQQPFALSHLLRLLGRGRHWVLVVLLLGNVVCPSKSTPTEDIVKEDGKGFVYNLVVSPALTSIEEGWSLDEKMSTGRFVSTTMIVIFGEIIPQAVSSPMVRPTRL